MHKPTVGKWQNVFLTTVNKLKMTRDENNVSKSEEHEYG